MQKYTLFLCEKQTVITETTECTNKKKVHSNGIIFLLSNVLSTNVQEMLFLQTDKHSFAYMIIKHQRL